MLRAENVIAGTTSTGTGNLTLAACPASCGGVDPLTAFGSMGFGTANGIPVEYSILEYSGTPLQTQLLQTETGFGLLTLGASIAGCTLVRSTATTSQPSPLPSYNFNPASPISVGVAANTIVIIGPNAASTMGCLGWFNATDGDQGLPCSFVSTTVGNIGPSNGQERYTFFQLNVPILAVRIGVYVATAQVGGTSNAYGRLYARGPVTGRPYKLLADFGLLGTAGSSLTTSGLVFSGANPTPPYLTPGPYAFSFFTSFSGQSTSPQLRGGTPYTDGGWGSNGMSPVSWAAASNGTNPAPDTANISSYSVGTGQGFLFLMRNS